MKIPIPPKEDLERNSAFFWPLPVTLRFYLACIPEFFQQKMAHKDSETSEKPLRVQRGKATWLKQSGAALSMSNVGLGYSCRHKKNQKIKWFRRHFATNLELRTCRN